MSRPKRTPILLLLTILLGAFLLYLYGERSLRHVLLYLSQARWARDLVTRFPPAWSVASRFVAGERIEDALRVTHELHAKGMTAALDYLGESVTDPAEACAARDHILELLDCVHELGLDAYVSVKLSQLGVKIDPALALHNLRTILERAQHYGRRVRIDMEESELVEITLDIYRQLRHEEGFDSVGVAIQAYLYRSEADVRQLAEEGAWVRLVKGAYMEPPEVAFPQKADTDANLVRLAHIMLGRNARHAGAHVAMASHDEQMIRATLDYVRAHNIPNDYFEFQMLYGIRREMQEALVAQGYPVRIYIPYGTAWYPYFMRRLAERPANLWFFLSNLVRR